MGESYSHWTLDERCRLRGLLEMGMGVSAIARRLNRHRSTIYREIERNRCVVGGYRPESADNRAWAAAHWAEVVRRMEDMAGRGILRPGDAPHLETARRNLAAAAGTAAGN